MERAEMKSKDVIDQYTHDELLEMAHIHYQRTGVPGVLFRIGGREDTSHKHPHIHAEKAGEWSAVFQLKPVATLEFNGRHKDSAYYQALKFVKLNADILFQAYQDTNLQVELGNQLKRL